MNTNTIELNLNETELANGGIDLWEGLNTVFLGAASGAVIGGGIGSSVPIVGTILGGVLGAGVGAAVGSGAVLIQLYSED